MSRKLGAADPGRFAFSFSGIQFHGTPAAGGAVHRAEHLPGVPGNRGLERT